MQFKTEIRLFVIHVIIILRDLLRRDHSSLLLCHFRLLEVFMYGVRKCVLCYCLFVLASDSVHDSLCTSRY